MEYGIGIMLVIAITGGIIAYIGDKLGSKIGKKRMTLLGLRPKYTAILVNVMTGILIATATIGVTAVLSNNVRTALFGMEQLRMEMEHLNVEISSKNAAIIQGKKVLSEKEKELEGLNDEVMLAREDFTRADLARAEMAGKLQSIEVAYQQAEEHLKVSEGEISSLEEIKATLTSQVHELETVTQKLVENISHLREGQVLFRVGEVLSGAVINKGLSESQYEVILANVLKDTNDLLLERIQSKEEKHMIYVTPENVKEISKLLAQSNEKMLVRILATGNVIYGEPVVVKIVAQPYQIVYKKGELVFEQTVYGGKKAQEVILSFLHDVNSEAKKKGVIPNPVTGEVGTLTGSELYLRIDELKAIKTAIVMQAIATEDTYTDGPIPITLHLESIP